MAATGLRELVLIVVSGDQLYRVTRWIPVHCCGMVVHTVMTSKRCHYKNNERKKIWCLVFRNKTTFTLRWLELLKESKQYL